MSQPYNDGITFGLSPERIRQLIALNPGEAKPHEVSFEIGVHLSKEEWARVFNRRAQANWRANNAETHRRRVRDRMRRLRALAKAKKGAKS